MKTEKIAGKEVILECEECGKTESFDRVRCPNCGEDVTFKEIKGWHRISRMAIGVPPTYSAYCSECWSEIQEEAREMVLEKGRVPCLDFQHSTHRVYSEQCTECRDNGYIPFDGVEWKKLMEEYREMRELVCPKCGREKQELSEAMVKTHMLDGSVTEFEGLRCPCGWEGFEYNLSLRKVK